MRDFSRLWSRQWASYGVSTYPDDALDMSGLLARADRAMFFIKDMGKDGVGDCRELSDN